MFTLLRAIPIFVVMTGALLGLRRGRFFTQRVGEIHWMRLIVGASV